MQRLKSIVFRFVQLNVPGLVTLAESRVFLNLKLFPPSLSVFIPNIVLDVNDGMKNSPGEENLIVMLPYMLS